MKICILFWHIDGTNFEVTRVIVFFEYVIKKTEAACVWGTTNIMSLNPVQARFTLCDKVCQ